jgi:Uma2 family endonuclease
MAANFEKRYTLEEYLQLDKQSEERFEYWQGEIFNMSGVSPEHDEIQGNFHYYLRRKLDGRNCRVFLANMRIKVPNMPPYRYGDLSALCGEPQFEKTGGIEALTNPSLIIEVLSPSTEAYDRGDKFTHYKSIPSFREYILVAQHRPHITQLQKKDDGDWIYREFNDLDAILRLQSLDCEIALRDVYQNVSFESGETTE